MKNSVVCETQKCGVDVASLWECTYAERRECILLVISDALSAGRDHSIVVEG